MDIGAPVERYDALVIGGGPAGLSAAVYLGRACRSVAVFECKRPGRSSWGQFNQNYLGFPDGISIDDLTDRGRAQAEKFGAKVIDTEVKALMQEEHGFAVTAGEQTYRGRAVILATGVDDEWAVFPGYQEYIGKTMHWCIACDGYEMQGQRVVIVGNDEHAAGMAIQMLTFRPQQVTVLTNHGALGIRPQTVERLQERGIRLIIDRIAESRAKDKGVFEAIVLEGGEEIELDHLFSVQGAIPNTALARSIGVKLNDEGYIKADTEGRTNIPGVFAAGDVTRLHSHQVVTAAHEGADAANAIVYELYEKDEDAFRVQDSAMDNG
jgi:thioredoxin reductase (NADPH)